MGVKGLWKYVQHHNITYVLPSKEEERKRSFPLACYPTYLFVDMNCVLHQVYEKKEPFTNRTIEKTIRFVEQLLQRFQPQGTVVFVFDGVAPTAKLGAQKDRRSGLSPSPPRVVAPPTTGWDNRYTCDLVHAEVPLRKEEITAGTEIVYACECELRDYLHRRKEEKHELWDYLVSSSTESGEGEIKIAKYLQQLYTAARAHDRYTGEESVTFVSTDSDLVMVAMAATPYHYLHLVDPLDFGVTAIHELFAHWSHTVPNPPLAKELLPSYRMDFIFLMLLAGCDYYDGLRDEAVAVWRRYRHLRADGGYYRQQLVSGPHFELNVGFLRELMQNPARAHGKQHGSRHQRGGQKKDGSDAGGGVVLLQSAMWTFKSFATGVCADYSFKSAGGGSKRASLSNLRAAAQQKGLARRIGADGGDANENKNKNDSHNTPAVAPVAPWSVLEQGIAVLGVRGRYSAELRGAFDTATRDKGHELTCSQSVRYLFEAVRALLQQVDRSRLTAAEQAMLARDPAEAGCTVETAFMQHAVVPPSVRKNKAPPPAATPPKEEEGKGDDSEAEEGKDLRSDASETE